MGDRLKQNQLFPCFIYNSYKIACQQQAGNPPVFLLFLLLWQATFIRIPPTIEDHINRLFFIVSCASNLVISHQSLSRWQKKLRETGDIESRGSGNYDLL